MMKRYLIVLLAVFQVFAVMGQKTSVEHSRVPVYLNAGAGLGVANYYDAGVSPLRYKGLTVGSQLGLSVQWSRCRIELDNTASGCLAASNKADDNVGAYGITIDPRVTFKYMVASPVQGKLRLWAGGTFNPYIDIRINAKMMNAALGLSEMIGLAGNFALEYDIPSRRRTDLFTLCFDFALPIAAYGERPGYVYVSNATESSEVADYVLDGYDKFFIAFPGATTEIGIYLNLTNGNRIGLTYRWDYRTTRRVALNRLDNAIHLVNLKFMFNIH